MFTMKDCAVPGCESTGEEYLQRVSFFNVPSQYRDGVVDPVKKRRRSEWLRAMSQTTELNDAYVKDMKVCSKHFNTGRPAPDHLINHLDWVPRLNLFFDWRKHNSIQNIINNLPEIDEQFDSPDYVVIDKVKAKKIEMDLIAKYMTNPICDENGFYNDDHDYLGLPVLPSRSENARTDVSTEHAYSIREDPACVYFDARHFCNICQINSANLFTFNTHMMVHTIKNDVTCNTCHQKFLTTTCLNNHLRTHKYLCRVCGRQVPTAQLRAHDRANEKQRNQANYGHKFPNRKKVLFCIFCMKDFLTHHDFVQHVALQHKRRNQIL